jgi:diamine N-acetyltransferase
MIRGSLVTLRPASLDDRQCVYDWMARSDATRWMMGPPLFCEAPIPTWDEFCADYVDLFFDGSRSEIGRSFIIAVEGEDIGHISCDRTQGFTELDIWLKSENVFGRGYGSDALTALMDYLQGAFGVSEFIIRPSRRNLRAIRAYEKAGFVPLPLSPLEQAALYGATEHYDTVAMKKVTRGRSES